MVWALLVVAQQSVLFSRFFGPEAVAVQGPARDALSAKVLFSSNIIITYANIIFKVFVVITGCSLVVLTPFPPLPSLPRCSAHLHQNSIRGFWNNIKYYKLFIEDWG